MKALIEFIAKSLVEHPEQVEVQESGNDDHIRLELSVAKDDMGRVIGSQVENAVADRPAPGARLRGGIRGGRQAGR